MESFINKVFDRVDAVIDAIIALMSTIMVLAVAMNVCLRWTLGRSIGEIDEISLMAFLWLVFVGMGGLHRSNQHIRMDFILKVLPPKARMVVELFNTFISAAVCTVMTRLSFKIMMTSFNRTLNVTHVPYSYMHLALLIGFAVMAVYTYFDLIIQILAIIKPKRQDAQQEGNPDKEVQ